MSKNVSFLGVARKFQSGQQFAVIASYSYNINVDLSLVKDTLNQPNISLVSGKHYSFSAGALGWHFLSDNEGLVYILLSSIEYPQRCAIMALQELQRVFHAEIGDKALTAAEGKLDKRSSHMLLTLCQKYDDLKRVDKLSEVKGKVESVQLVMNENIRIALENTVKLESIDAQADDLAQAAGVFNRNAKELRRKMWWKNMKMKLLFGGIALVILAIIITICVVMTKQGK